MTALHSMRRTTSTAAVLATAGVVLVAGCGARDFSDARVQAQTQTLPVAVNCEPLQRAIVRPVAINGAAMSQVDCVSVDPGVAPAPVAVPAYQGAVPAALPVSYAPASFARPQTASFEEARVAPVAAPAPVARRVVYERPVERTIRPQQRSVAKSALIIGSSAGAGAGLGALIGGKKGALIGAAAAGGGATLWDQITRRKPQ
jgi:hypothetical protein